jgi:hypothetical protein
VGYRRADQPDNGFTHGLFPARCWLARSSNGAPELDRWFV